MRGIPKPSDLIEEIYDAAVEPARWNDVVVRINDFVQSQACGIISKDLASKSGATHYYCGADPHYIQLYAETYAQFDPLATLPSFGRVVSIPDLLPYDEYRRGPFYQEWLQPQGCVDVANALLRKSAGGSAILLTFLPGKSRMMDHAMRQRIALIVPHTKRALSINEAIDFKQSEAAVFSDTLDGLNAGVFIVDASTRIVHANTSGQDMLCADDFLRLVDGQLVARNKRASLTLHSIFKGIAAGNNVECTALLLTAHDETRYVAHILPLTSAARSGIGSAYKAVAAVFVRRMEINVKSCGELVARHFELTPAELRVLIAIVEIGGVPEVADALGVAETTVRTHLQHIFSKTGVSRQADLVKLTTGFSSPLVG